MRRREVLRLSLTNNGQWFNQPCLWIKSSMKIFLSNVPRNLLNWRTHQWCVGLKHLETAWKLCTTSFFALCTSSIWLLLSCILHNEAMVVITAFSWVFWAILMNHWTWRGIMGISKVVAESDRSISNLVTPTCG